MLVSPWRSRLAWMEQQPTVGVSGATVAVGVGVAVVSLGDADADGVAKAQA